MIHTAHTGTARARDVQIRSGAAMLHGDLSIPTGAQGAWCCSPTVPAVAGTVPRNQFVARTIREAGVGTLLFDLLTAEEEALDARTAHLRFDIGLLAARLIDATYWLKGELDYLRVGYFGSSTGGGAALVAAAELGEIVSAVVSRGGRPDLAGDALPQVKSPTLLIVGGLDYPVIEMNEAALAQMRCEKQLEIVPGATHLFEEPGTLEQVADLAAEWFQRHLVSAE